MPRDADAAAAILASAPDAASRPGGEIQLAVAGPGTVDGFLASFGSRIREMTLVEATLETVFLSLTGRDLRDAAAGQRERTYAFGQRGGEHTR